jgi:hypothetical protein
MKIDIVTMSTNNNPLYYEFWEPVSKVWKTKFNIHPVLAFVGNNKIEMSQKFGDVIYLPSIKGIADYILAAWARFYIIKFFPDNICMETDIDIAPLSHKYFINDIAHLDDDCYHNLDFGIYNKGDNNIWKTRFDKVVSGCYHIAKGSLFQKVCNFSDSWKHEMLKLDAMKFPIPFAYSTPTPKWALDELYITQLLRETIDLFPDIKIITKNNNYDVPNVDRSDWKYDPELVKQGLISYLINELKMRIIQQNRIKDLNNNNDIFFIRFEHRKELISKLKNYNKKCCLITGHSAGEISHQEVENHPDCVQKWIGQNLNSTHPIAIGLPVGIEDSEEHNYADRKIELLLKMNEETKHFEPEHKLYANFDISTNPFNRAERPLVAKICLNNLNCNCHIHSSVAQKIDIEDYYKIVSNHKMTVCPGGLGKDTVRMWEVLYLNRVPIVKKSFPMLHFKNLPILFIDDWSELNNYEYLIQEYNKIKNNSLNMLDLDYWINFIKKEVESYV